MSLRNSCVLAGLALAALTLAAAAQNPAALVSPAAPAPVVEAPFSFSNQGSVTLGERYTSTSGYEPMYLELLNLRSGPRLMDFNLFGQAAAPHQFADHYSLTMSGLGGDPFPTAQINVAKDGLYSLTAQWSQSYFIYAPNQNVILPGGVPALTSEHQWSTVRKFGTLNFMLFATRNLRFGFQYYRTSDSGATVTPMTPSYVGAAYPTYGFFEEESPYLLYAPTLNNADRFTGSMDYTLGRWTIHYAAGYQTLNDSMSFNNLTSPEFSFDTSTAATANTPVFNFSMSQFRQLTTPISDFSYTGQLWGSVDLRGSYLYERFSGPASYDEAFNGIAPTSLKQTVFAPYTVSQGAKANVSEPQQVAAQGLTWKLEPWASLETNYRYTRSTEDNLSVFSGLFNGTPLASNGNAAIVWKNGISTFDARMVFTPLPSLLISPGVQLLKTDVESISGGVADPALTLRTNTVVPELSAYFQPWRRLSLRGDLRTYDSGSSYTAISPHTQTSGMLALKADLGGGFTLNNTLRLSSSQLLDANYHDRMQANATLLNYRLNRRLSLYGGFSYDGILARGDIVFRTTTDTLRDQEIDHVWQAGVQWQPLDQFGVQLTGNWDHTSGVGEISNNLPPAYGPVTWPYATGSVFYDFPAIGKLSADLTRTYYMEQIVTGNNFGATLFTVSWTHGF
jgi:hypothetical protein